MTVWEELKARGLIAQVTNEEEISKREAAQEEINKQNQEALKKAADELAQKASQDAINESLRKQGESSGIGRGSGWKLGPSGK